MLTCDVSSVIILNYYVKALWSFECLPMSDFLGDDSRTPKHYIHPIHPGLAIIDCFPTALAWHALWILGWDMSGSAGASLRGTSALGDL